MAPILTRSHPFDRLICDMMAIEFIDCTKLVVARDDASLPFCRTSHVSLQGTITWKSRDWAPSNLEMEPIRHPEFVEKDYFEWQTETKRGTRRHPPLL